MNKREINFDDKVSADVRGPTEERIRMAGDAYVVGGEDRGTRIYFFADSPLQRLYARLRARAGQRETEELTKEYTALMKYKNHWYGAGLEASLSSVDPNRIYSSDPSNFSGMAKTERQYSHRVMYRLAGECLMKAMGPQRGHSTIVLLDNFICYERDRGIASGLTPYLFRKTVRTAAAHLAKHWGIG